MPGLRGGQHGRRWLDSRDGRELDLCAVHVRPALLHVDAGQRAGRVTREGFLALIADDGRVRAGWLSLVAALPPRAARDPAACQGRSASHPPGRAHPAVPASRYPAGSSGLPAFRTCHSSSHRRAHPTMPPTTPAHAIRSGHTQPGPGHRQARSGGLPQRQTVTPSARPPVSWDPDRGYGHADR